MTPEKCPNCGHRLEPTMLACPNCPMSFPEFDPASEIHPLKQSRYYQFLMPVLFFVGLGWGIWSIAEGLYNIAEQSTNAVPDLTIERMGSGPAPAAKPGAPLAAPEMAAAPGAAAPKAEEELSVVVEKPARKRVRQWRLRGAVYDLADLRPITRCTMIFSDAEADHRIMTQTDSAGRYQVVVPSLADRGYEVQVRKEGYSPSYLHSDAQSVSGMTAARRQELAQTLGATLSASPATFEAPDEKPFVVDFYVARRPWTP